MEQADNIKKIQKRAKQKERAEMEKKAKIYEFVAGDNWQLIRNKLIERVAELNSIVDLNDQQCDRQNTLAIKKAVQIVLGWLGEVEGDANVYQIEMETLKTRTKDKIIHNLDDDEE